VLTTGDHTAQEMAAYLSGHVLSDAMIETWEPEMAFLTEHRYHLPPSRVLDAYSRAKAIGAGEEMPAYNPLTADPDYILIGEFGWWTELYSQEFLAKCCQMVKTVGTYALFEVISQAESNLDEREGTSWQSNPLLNPTNW